MIEKILFNLIAFSLFINIFLFKLVKKNDTTYLCVIVAEAIGIAINFISILFNIWDGIFIKVIMYLLAIIFPIAIFILERNGINISESINVFISKVYLVYGNTKKAKEQLINLTTKYQNSYLGHKMLAEIYEKEGGIRKAVDEYTKVIEIKTDAYNIEYKLATLLVDLERKDEAIKVLNNVLSKKPEYIDATNLLGEILCEKQAYKEAVSIYLAALKYNPKNYELYYNLGLVYTMLNDFQNAKAYYDKAAEINHELYNGNYCLGKISLLYRDIELAEEYFAKALMGELEADAYYELAKIYMIKDEKEKAIIFINKAIELDGKYVDIVKDEPIFLIIRQYINLPINVLEETKRDVKLDSKETVAIEHLEEIYELTKSLSVNEIRRSFEAKKIQELEKDSKQQDIQRDV